MAQDSGWSWLDSVPQAKPATSKGWDWLDSVPHSTATTEPPPSFSIPDIGAQSQVQAPGPGAERFQPPPQAPTGMDYAKQAASSATGAALGGFGQLEKAALALPERVDAAKNWLAGIVGKEYGVLGMGEPAQKAARALMGGLEPSGVSMTRLIPEEQRAKLGGQIAQGASSVAKAIAPGVPSIEQAAQATHGFQNLSNPAWWATQVPAMAGGLAPAVAAGAVLGPPGFVLTMAVQGGEDLHDRVLQETRDKDKAAAAFWTGAAINGALGKVDAAALQGLIRIDSITNGLARKVVSFATSTAATGAAGTAAGVASKAVEDQLSGKDLDLWREIQDQLPANAVLAAGLSAVGAARGKGTEKPPDVSPKIGGESAPSESGPNLTQPELTNKPEAETKVSEGSVQLEQPPTKPMDGRPEVAGETPQAFPDLPDQAARLPAEMSAEEGAAAVEKAAGERPAPATGIQVAREGEPVSSMLGAIPEGKTGTRGALDLFGPRNPQPAAPSGKFDVPDETRRDRVYSGLVNDLERIVQLERAAPKKIAGESVEQGLSLMPGRKYGESEKLRVQAIEPLKAMLKGAQIPPIESTPQAPSASDYLYAVHATEAPDSAEMGMKPADAKAIRSQAESGPNAAAYAKIRDWNRALNVKRLDTLEAGGLISPETRKAWEDKYGPDYVPVRTAQDPFEQYVGQGRGLGVRGKESKARKGRSSRADSPLVFALETMDTATERAESNRIGQRIGELVEKNPDGPWKVEADQNKRKPGEEWLPFKVNGEQRFIVTEDRGLAEAFKRLQVPDPGLLKVLDPLLKYWHKVIIQYNPVFPLTNVPRDMGVASIRHAIEGDLPAAMGTLKNGLPAAKGAFAAIREEGAGGKWGDVYRKARDAGALIGWKEVQDYGERVKDFEKAVSRTSKAAAFGALIDDLNRATELGTRLATFDALLKSGKTEAEAAMGARRITADFARRGRWGPTYRRLYLFSGANVQGTSEMLGSIAKNPGRASTVIGALIGAGFSNYALSKLYGDDAELDKLSESDKARFFGPMLGKRRYGFAAPYGFNLFPYLGWKLGEATLGGQSPKKMLGGLASTALDSFSPLPQGASVTQSLTPTVGRPFEEIAENKKFSGAPIEPDQSPFDRVPKPHSQRFFPSVSGASKEVAQGLNRLTGGDELQPGMVDVSPEWIDHLAAAASGGLGTFAGRTLNVAKAIINGDMSDIRLSDIPIFRPFVQEASRGSGTRVYKENLTELELAKKQAKAGKEVGEPGLLSLDRLAKETDKRISALYKIMDSTSEKDRPRYQEAIDALHDRFNAAAKAAKKR